MTPIPSRRSFVLGAGAAVFVAACSSSDEPVADVVSSTSSPATDASTATTASSTAPATTAEGAAIPALTPAMFAALPICVAAPDAPAGPFPTIEQLDRHDVTEDYPGHPVRLGIRVVDAECNPVPGAEVEIWHADATGDYSSFEDGGSGKDEGEGTTFCRGFQTADADGILEFTTIYPGWYEGRAVHIHVRARVDGQEVLTSQLYFDEAYTERVYTEAPYAEFGPPDTTWANDGLIGSPDIDGSAVTVAAGATSRGDGTLGLINLGLPR